jgi:carboxyl-terminal processing protease
MGSHFIYTLMTTRLSSLGIFILLCLTCQTPAKSVRTTGHKADAKTVFAESKKINLLQQQLLHQVVSFIKKDYFRPLSDYEILKIWLNAPLTQKTWVDLKQREDGSKLLLTCGDKTEIIQPADFKFDSFWLLYDNIISFCNPAQPADFQPTYTILKGITSGLQKGTEFYNPAETADMTTEFRGNFGGIGLEISRRDGNIVIVDTLEDSPARKGGILKDDILESIENKPVKGMTLSGVIRMLRGKPASRMTVQIQRSKKAKLIEFELVREIVKIQVVKQFPGTDRVLHLQVRQLSPTAVEDLQNWIRLDKRDLLLDLRGCPGGMVDAAHHMAELFLPSGKIVFTSRGRKKEFDKVFKTNNQYADTTRRIVVLADGATAGGCEIVAAALKYHKRARLAGAPTLGRGTIQNAMALMDGSSFENTFQEIFLANGETLEKRPVTPDVAFSRDTEFIPAALKLFSAANESK